jgi:hypothetical protein
LRDGNARRWRLEIDSTITALAVLMMIAPISALDVKTIISLNC